MYHRIQIRLTQLRKQSDYKYRFGIFKRTSRSSIYKYEKVKRKKRKIHTSFNADRCFSLYKCCTKTFNIKK